MKKKIKGRIGQVKQHQLFSDTPLLILVLINLALLAGILFWSLTNISPTELAVPVRFTSFANFDLLGKWYQLYELFGIAVVTFIINLVLALVAHSIYRFVSAALLCVSIVVAVYCAAMLVGFTAINYGGV